jgi:hypothetical protein
MIEEILQRLNSIPADKVMHFASGSVLFALCLPFISSHYALVMVVVSGISKELYDTMHNDKHTPDLLDAVATSLGGALGYFCTNF